MSALGGAGEAQIVGAHSSRRQGDGVVDADHAVEEVRDAADRGPIAGHEAAQRAAGVNIDIIDRRDRSAGHGGRRVTLVSIRAHCPDARRRIVGGKSIRVGDGPRSNHSGRRAVAKARRIGEENARIAASRAQRRAAEVHRGARGDRETGERNVGIFIDAKPGADCVVNGIGAHGGSQGPKGFRRVSVGPALIADRAAAQRDRSVIVDPIGIGLEQVCFFRDGQCGRVDVNGSGVAQRAAVLEGGRAAGEQGGAGICVGGLDGQRIAIDASEIDVARDIAGP